MYLSPVDGALYQLRVLLQPLVLYYEINLGAFLHQQVQDLVKVLCLVRIVYHLKLLIGQLSAAGISRTGKEKREAHCLIVLITDEKTRTKKNACYDEVYLRNCLWLLDSSLLRDKRWLFLVNSLNLFYKRRQNICIQRI